MTFFMLPNFSKAATYYVSPTGEASWPVCTNINVPCSAQAGMSNAVAGDVVYFLDGIYSVIQNDPDYKIPALHPTNSGTAGNPIIFKSLNQHGANIHGIGATAEAYVSTVLGSYHKNYITWDGFLITARNQADTVDIMVTLRVEADYCVIKNCEFVGGTHSQGGANNNAAISMNNASYLTIENNEIHEYKETSNNYNNNCINGYDSHHIVIKNNEIYECTNGIHFKDNIDDSLIQDNYLHDNYVAFLNTNDNLDGACERNTLINNVIAGSKYMAMSVWDNINSAEYDERADDLIFSNNTFYGNPNTNDQAIGMDTTFAGHRPKFYNNIITGFNKSLGMSGADKEIAEADHNQWGTSMLINLHIYESNETTYNSIASWQGSDELEGNLSPGVGDLMSDPGFVNVSGNFSLLTDFALASNSFCRAAGREGLDMGADISSVGVFSSSTDLIAPSSPNGLSVM